MKKVNIYALIDPRYNTPFYVGATQIELRTRLSQHVFCAKNNIHRKTDCHKRDELIKDIISDRKRVQIILLERVSIKNATSSERKYFLKFKKEGHPIYQSKHGFSYTESAETRKKTILKRQGLAEVILVSKHSIIKKASNKANSEGLTLADKIDVFLSDYINSVGIQGA